MERVDLAYDIICTDFGPFCAAVCRQLVRNGPQTLRELAAKLIVAGDPFFAHRSRAASSEAVAAPLEPTPIPSEFFESPSSSAFVLASKSPRPHPPFMSAAELQSSVASLLLHQVITASTTPKPYARGKGPNQAAVTAALSPQASTRPVAAVVAAGERLAQSSASDLQASPSQYMSVRYAFEPGAAISRLRRVRHMNLIRQHFGPAGALIAEQLAIHGVCSKDDITEQARERKEVVARVQAGEGDEVDVKLAALVTFGTARTAFDPSHVAVAWDSMVAQGLVVRAAGQPLPEPWLGGMHGAIAVRPPVRAAEPELKGSAGSNGAALGASMRASLALQTEAAKTHWGAADAAGSSDDEGSRAGGVGGAGATRRGARLGLGVPSGGGALASAVLAARLRPPGNAKRVRSTKRRRPAVEEKDEDEDEDDEKLDTGTSKAHEVSDSDGSKGDDDDGDDGVDEERKGKPSASTAPAPAPVRRGRGRAPEMAAPAKRLKPAAPPSSRPRATRNEKPGSLLWRLGAAAIDCRDRDIAVSRYVSQRISVAAGLAVGAALDCAYSSGSATARAGISADVHAKDVIATMQGAFAEVDRAAKSKPRDPRPCADMKFAATIAVLRKPTGALRVSAPPAWSDVVTLLELLGSRDLGFAKRMQAGADGGIHQIDIAKLTARVRERTLESFVEKRFGVIAARIMRLLRARGMLEDRTVGDVAMLPIKDVRAMLARLHAARVLDLRQIPRRSDTAPASTIFLWHLNERSLSEAARLSVVESIMRLRARGRLEAGKLFATQDAEARAPAAAAAGSAFQTQIESLGHGIDMIDSSILALDSTLAALQLWSPEGEGSMASAQAQLEREPVTKGRRRGAKALEDN